MNKGGIGTGSASIVLVFAVLCLTIFATISFTSALADSALAEVEAELVKNYYAADTLAEEIVGEIVFGENIPESVRGVEIWSEWDWELMGEKATFACPVSEKKELVVTLAVYEGSYDILTWRMRDTYDWEADEGIKVWPGFDFEEDDLASLWTGG